MRLNQTGKVIVGLGSAWVVFFPLIIIFVWIFGIFLGPLLDSDGDIVTIFFGLSMIIFVGLTFLNIPIYYLTLGFYIFHIVKNRDGSELIRVITAIGLHFLPFLVVPIYYFIFILPDRPPDWALEPSRSRG